MRPPIYKRHERVGRGGADQGVKEWTRAAPSAGKVGGKRRRMTNPADHRTIF